MPLKINTNQPIDKNVEPIVELTLVDSGNSLGQVFLYNKINDNGNKKLATFEIQQNYKEKGQYRLRVWVFDASGTQRNMFDFDLSTDLLID